MKNVSDLILENRTEFNKWLDERMKHNYSFIYTKGNIGGYDLSINMSCKCIDTSEVFEYIWKEINPALLDTDSCSFGELT